MRLKLNLVGVDAELTDDTTDGAPVLRRHLMPHGSHDYHADDIVNGVTGLTAKQCIRFWASPWATLLAEEESDLVQRFLNS